MAHLYSVFVKAAVGFVSNTSVHHSSVCRPPSGRETTALCPGNKSCLHDTKEVRFLKTSCQDFLTSGLKYQHLSPPSPEIDYIPIRVELREQTTRALLEVQETFGNKPEII